MNSVRIHLTLKVVENTPWKLMDIVNKQTDNEKNESISIASEFVFAFKLEDNYFFLTCGSSHQYWKQNIYIKLKKQQVH